MPDLQAHASLVEFSFDGASRIIVEGQERHFDRMSSTPSFSVDRFTAIAREHAE